MAVRINFNPDSEVPEFFDEITETGKFGEKFVQFSSVDILEQAIMHSKLMENIPNDITVADLRVYTHSEAYLEIGSSGTFHYETKWGSARIVVTGATIALEATDPRSFLDAHRAILNGLVTQDHKVLVQNY